MKALLFHLDGRLPNLALMRIAAHHRERGDEVELRRSDNPSANLWDGIDPPMWLYGGGIFRRTIPIIERLKRAFPNSIIGGTAVDPPRKGELVPLSPVISPIVTSTAHHGISEIGSLDYSIYPWFKQSMGFTQRGCRLKCDFCVVPTKEGKVREAAGIYDIWRGGSHPKELLLLDNDFFGQPNWRTRISEIREGRFKVSFNQGINARCITDEAAEAIASVDYRNDAMDTRRIYTAWDNRADEERLFLGLNRLVKYGVKPDHIMVYMLIGFWPGETAADREYRRARLREFRARPYPMPFTRTDELIGFQRWVIGAYDKPKKNRRGPRVPWKDWVANNYRPEGLQLVEDAA